MKISLKPIDIDIFENELNSFLPKKIFDMHTHLWSEKHIGQCVENSGLRVEMDFMGLKECCSTLFPGRKMHFALLGTPIKHIEYNDHNNWLAQEAAKDSLSQAFMLTIPNMTSEFLLEQIEENCYAGFKPYRVFAEDMDEARIKDYLPENQMEVANEKGLCVTLHLAKFDGVADKYNQNDLKLFTNKYPGIKWILAHCARCFNSRFLEQSIYFLKDLPNIFYDTSAVCDLHSHILLLKHEDKKRILYGSDLLAASGVRGKYISYGNAWEYYKGNQHLAYCDPEATFVIYEQLRAQKQAAEIIGLTTDEVQDMFYNNAMRLLQFKREKA